MANWQRKIDFHESFSKAQDGELTIQELSKEIAAKLRAVKDFGDSEIDDERDELADEFEALSTDTEAHQNEFDDVLSRLYDWGDTPLDDNWPTKKVCWIGAAF